MLWRMTVCSLFCTFGIKEGSKITRRWEKARRGLGYRVIKMMCSLEGGCASKGSEKEHYSGISKVR